MILEYSFELAPIPWTMNFKGLDLVTDLSNCRMLPAAAFLWFENLSFSFRELFNFKTDIKEIYDHWFSSGTRYNIIEEILDKAREYNLLVEVGAGGCSTLKYFNESYKFKKIIGYKEVIDMPDLINRGRKNGLKIGVFAIHEEWSDMGRPEDFLKKN